MKVALISDSHLHPFQAFSSTINGVNSRLLETLKWVRWAAEIAKDKECKYLIHLGDVFESRNHIDVLTWNLSFDTFWRCADIVDMIFIAGNHDIADEAGTCTIKSFQAFAHVVMPETSIQKGNLLLVPYGPTFVSEQLKKHRHKDLILLSHFGVIGCDMGYGKLSTDGVSMDDLKGFRQVFLGHYHVARWPYVGCLCPVDLKAPNQPGRMIILDDETAEYEVIENGAPRFIKISSDKPLPNENKAKGNYITVEGPINEGIKEALLIEEVGAKGVRFTGEMKAPVEEQTFSKLANLDEVAAQLAQVPPDGISSEELMETWKVISA